jgi:hypothetical protein
MHNRYFLFSLGTLIMLVACFAVGCVSVSDKALSDYQWQQQNPSWHSPVPEDPNVADTLGKPKKTPEPTTAWP